MSSLCPSATPPPRPSRAVVAAYAAFAAFGLFWGAWGAALPAIRTQANLSEGQLGTALLFVGVGALPAMALIGRPLDRWGTHLAAIPLALLGVAGLGVALLAHDYAAVVLCMLLVGATSGVADVAINTMAGHAEQHSGRPVLTRSHGAFSVAVVIASLGAGVMLTHNLPLAATFTVVALAIVMLAGLVGASRHPSAAVRERSAPGLARPRAARSVRLRVAAPLLLLGGVCALAYAIENAHQSWGAVFLTDTFAASPQLAALAPATFAAAAAVTRLSLAPLSRSHPLPLMLAGGALATAGSALLALAPNAALGLAGIGLAAVGTATLFPTLLSHSLRHAHPAHRGRATSIIATTAYLGFLLGPAYVGLVADNAGLRIAVLGVAALALAFTLSALPTSRYAGRMIARPS